jgi:non-ribosomal peptide synthetase component F
MSKREIHVAAPSLRMALIEAERTARGSGGQETALRDWVRALEATAPIPVQRQRTLHAVIAELAETQGDAPALLSAGESLTYAELVARASRFARWALTQNLAKGEVVCLMMPNRPEYLAIWLGLTSVGIVVSLINTNLRGASLAHCIDLAAPAHVIVAAELSEQFRSGVAELKSEPKIWSHGGDEFERIDRAVEDLSSERLNVAERRAVTIADRALLIYTSGTTGLPAALSQRRRRRGDRLGAGGRRLDRDPRKILGAAFLGRHRRMGLHTRPVHRRARPLSAQRAASSARASAPHPAVLRQWAAGRRLEEIPGAFQDSAHPGVLCRY